MNTEIEPESAIAQAVGRGRLPLVFALIGISLLAWAYLFILMHQMADMPEMGQMSAMELDVPGMGMPAVSPSGSITEPAMAAMTTGFRPWTPADFALSFAMWWVMMVGMMTPSAAPMILMFDRVSQRNRARGAHAVPTVLFVGAYLAIWGAFSLLATFGQWGLESAALTTPMQRTTSPILGGAVFIGAGLFQFTPLKDACLRQCRSPLSFIMEHWRDGTAGALALGVRHGLYCLGCCWFLMALLFVGGVMNLLWVAAIAIYVLAEKLLPAGAWIARCGGAAMVLLGSWLIATA